MIDGPDDGGLGSEARALLDLAREGLSPDAAAIARVHGRLGAATAGAAAGTAIGVKLALVSLAIAIAAGAGLYLRHEPPAASPLLELAAVPPSVPPVYEVAHEPAIAPLPVLAPAPHVARPIADEPPPTSAPPPTPPATPPGPPPALADLSRELELIDLAMTSLRGHRPDDALRAVHRHTFETAGHGQLAEDAAAIEVEALCQLHDEDTADKLAAFDARFPHSAQRSRLTTRCP